MNTPEQARRLTCTELQRVVTLSLTQVSQRYSEIYGLLYGVKNPLTGAAPTANTQGVALADVTDQTLTNAVATADAAAANMLLSIYKTLLAAGHAQGLCPAPATDAIPTITLP
jgi:hypothetical protein